MQGSRPCSPRGWRFLKSADIGAGEVKSPDILDAAVKATDIADGHVRGSEIADNAVGSSEIGPDAVDSSKIADNAVGSSKIADDAVDSSEIAASAVRGDDLLNYHVHNGTSVNVTDGTALDGDFQQVTATASCTAGEQLVGFYAEWTSGHQLGDSARDHRQRHHGDVPGGRGLHIRLTMH